MISLFILLLGSGTFMTAVVIHIMIWRAIRPVKQLFYLGIIFILIPSSIYILFFSLSQTSACSGKYLVSPFSMAFGFLWHFTLSSVYIASYPLFQAECPSLKIILAVSSSMPGGMTAEAIDRLFSEKVLLDDRLKDLFDERFIFQKNGKYIISRKGRVVSVFFLIYRRLLGLPLGEG